MEIAQCTLDGNADAVEFCPIYPHHDILAAATYTLQEGMDPVRLGSISLFSVSADEGLELLQKTPTAAGVFDIKWKPNQAGPQCLLVQADADGQLSLYSLEPELEKGCLLKEVSNEKICPSMCLCVDWKPSASAMAVGLSDGSVSMVTLNETKVHHLQSWDAHGYEVWSTVFDLHQPELLYTGSDDCRLCCWDIRQSPSMCVFQNSKAHTMGVCCIAKNPSDHNILITGSYDEHLRVWDLRSVSKPLMSNSTNLGGGIWRVKYHPYNSSLLLAACMHNGFAIVRMTDDGFELTERYEKHDSLAYGADWQKGELNSKHETTSRTMVATCSFYDRRMRVWLPETLVGG